MIKGCKLRFVALFLFPLYNLGMDEKEILQRQVDALEKLLQIKEAIIQEQEARITKLENAALIEKFPQFPGVQFPQIPPPPFMPSIPSVWQVDPCSDGQLHEYDFPWHSTSPQPCKKCGKTMPQPSWTITSSNSALVDEERALGTITDIANKKDV